MIKIVEKENNRFVKNYQNTIYPKLFEKLLRKKAYRHGELWGNFILQVFAKYLIAMIGGFITLCLVFNIDVAELNLRDWYNYFEKIIYLNHSFWADSALIGPFSLQDGIRFLFLIIVIFMVIIYYSWEVIKNDEAEKTAEKINQHRRELDKEIARGKALKKKGLNINTPWRGFRYLGGVVKGIFDDFWSYLKENLIDGSKDFILLLKTLCVAFFLLVIAIVFGLTFFILTVILLVITIFLKKVKNGLLSNY